MARIWASLPRVFERSEHGATATEYALVIAVIALVLVAAITVFGNQMDGLWLRLGSTMRSVF